MQPITTRLTAIGLALPLVLGMAGSALAQDDGGSNQASCNYPGDLTGGKPLVIVIEGLGDPSSGFFRTLNNGAQQAGKDLCVEVRYIYPQGGSFDLASYTQQIEQSIAAQPDGIVILGIGDLDDGRADAVRRGHRRRLPAGAVREGPGRCATRTTSTCRASAPTSTPVAPWPPTASSPTARSRSSASSRTPPTARSRCAARAWRTSATEAGVKYQLVAGNPDPARRQPCSSPSCARTPTSTPC